MAYSVQYVFASEDRYDPSHYPAKVKVLTMNIDSGLCKCLTIT